MPQGPHAYSTGEQSGASVKGLQRTLNVCDGLRDNDLPPGVYVPCDSTVTHLHELRRTTFVSTNAVCHWITGEFPDVQKELQVR